MTRLHSAPTPILFVPYVVLLLATSADMSSSFSPPHNMPVVRPSCGVVVVVVDGAMRTQSSRRRRVTTTTATTTTTTTTTTRLSSAMERLHDPSTNHYGRVEHVYSPREIGTIAQKVYDDEWTALGSVIAETMLETILDVGDDALSGRGWVEKTTVTNGIAEEVTSAVEKALHNVRSQPVGGFDRGPHSIPRELLTPLHALLRHSLNAIVGLDGTTDAPFRYNGRDLSLLVRSAVTEAIESYCGIANANAPFFDLVGEMDRRASSRGRDLLAKHSRGYESVRDVLDDIESSRLTWLREVLGSRAVVNYEFGEVTTKAGNGHSHEKERTARRGRRFEILKGLFRDLEGVLMP